MYKRLVFDRLQIGPRNPPAIPASLPNARTYIVGYQLYLAEDIHFQAKNINGWNTDRMNIDFYRAWTVLITASHHNL